MENELFNTKTTLSEIIIILIINYVIHMGKIMRLNQDRYNAVALISLFITVLILNVAARLG